MIKVTIIFAGFKRRNLAQTFATSFFVMNYSQNIELNQDYFYVINTFTLEPIIVFCYEVALK